MKRVATKNLDNLGRVVIPLDIRQNYNLLPDEPVDIICTDEGVLIKAHKEVCVICEQEKRNMVTTFGGKQICNDCIKSLSESEKVE